ncbi:MAG: tRNA (guanosine(46)-N7)-methyltransferase TrmB [Actinomycetota bacterium]
MERPSVRSYQLRGARMTKAQKSAIDQHGDDFIVIPTTAFRPKDLFPAKGEVIVEIGSGMGEATSLIAKTFPEMGFLAIEVHRPGIGSLILRALDLEVSNLKMINEDCHLILDLIADESVDTFHIFFPDPWPKTKHRKRRLINEDFVGVLATKLKSGGSLRIATDWADYAKQISEVISREPRLTGGVCERPEWRPLTKFESQGIDKKHAVTDFYYLKK